MREIKRRINEILDKQEAKGIATYGHGLEDCPDSKYNWQHMIIEELVDALQYSVKDNLKMKKELEAWKQQSKF